MGLRTIAILSPGDMGHGVGMALVGRGFDVITCLAGRSRADQGPGGKGGHARRAVA